ncbi:MAG TPA: FadR/GntR family transcriptional regulator [Paracoccaceae bacterium]
MIEPGSLIRALSGRMAARNYHSFVINEIGVGIVSGAFAVGTILPNDSEMMAMYGVSRTVLREALKTLEAKGLVEARPKVGTRVSPVSRWSLFDQQVLQWHYQSGVSPGFLTNLCSIRLSLERDAVRLACKHRTADHLRMMIYWLQQMDLSPAGSEPRALAELELHRMIADASQNPFLRAISPLVEFVITVAVTPDDPAPPGSDAHVALIAAIEAGDADHAEDLLCQIVAADLQRGLAQLARGSIGSIDGAGGH